MDGAMIVKNKNSQQISQDIQNMAHCKVAVTGIGLATSLGRTEQETWDNLLRGTTGIRKIQALNTDTYKSKNAAEIPENHMAKWLSESNLSPRDRTVDLAMLASLSALKQSRLINSISEIEPSPCATIVGTGTGVSNSIYETFKGYFEKGIRGIRPTSVPRGMANAISSQISMFFKLTGPNYVITSACSSSTNAIGTGYRMIRHGYADHVLCVGADAPFDEALYGAWNNLGVMSKNHDPLAASRPFDTDRDGCVLGEGAGALVLENMDTAKRKGKSIRAEIAGYGESSDAMHITRPDPVGQATAINAAMQTALITPEDVTYINAHGTGTRSNDPVESASIRKALGKETDRIPVVSNKSFFGHLLGASGAVETAITIISLEKNISPPNLNLINPDPECNLNLVGLTPQKITTGYALKNSFGFGGNNAVLALKLPD